MKWDTLKKLDKAPGEGNMLLYLRTELIFKPYKDIAQVKSEIGEQDILELHLFDNQKEYRALASESPRFESGCIEWIADFKTEGCFIDEVILEENGSRMTIVNHISYDDSGMAAIDDYRLIMGKG